MAIRSGKRDVHRRALMFFIISSAGGIILACCGLSLWLILAGVVAGGISAFLHVMILTPKWRNWAYAGVADIHQFQRCAELESLLPPNTVFEEVGLMNAALRQELTLLQERFHDDLPFLDDAEVLQSVHIYEAGLFVHDPSRPFLNISREGITVRQLGFFPWSDISNEHIGVKSTTRGRFRQSYSGTTCFCFAAPGILFEHKLSRLLVGIAELDQILHIQRGRYENDRAGKPVIVPLNSAKPATDL